MKGVASQAETKLDRMKIEYAVAEGVRRCLK
jgi:hypothetical protein